MNTNVKPLYHGRASFGPQGPQEQVPHHSDPKDARPIFNPDAADIERIRHHLPGRRPEGLDRSRDPIQDVARRLRREHLGDAQTGYALVSTGDLDAILAWIEERA